MITVIEWAVYVVGSLGVLALLSWAALELTGLITKQTGMFWRTCWCVGNWDKVQAFMKEQAREDANARAYVNQDQADGKNVPLPVYKPGTNAYVIIQDGWSRGFGPQQTLDELEAQGYTGWDRDMIKIQWEMLDLEMEATNKAEDEDRTLDYGDLKRRAEDMTDGFKGPSP